MYSEILLVRFVLDVLKSSLVSLDNSAWEFDVGKGIRQTIFGQSKAGLWSRKSHHPTPTPGSFDYPTPTPTLTPDRL